MQKAYGGVVISETGQVLLREPTKHYDGYVDVPQRKVDPGEPAEETALREVEEETRMVAKIVAKLPGSFPGSTTDNEYFLMLPLEDRKEFKDETQSVHGVTQSEAEKLIAMTTNCVGKDRDLKVLKAAFEIFAKDSC